MSFFEGSQNDPNTNHYVLGYNLRTYQKFSWQQSFLGSHQICSTSYYKSAQNPIFWTFSTEYQIGAFDWSNVNTVSDNNNLINPQPIGPIASPYVQSYKPSYVVFKGIFKLIYPKSKKCIASFLFFNALFEINHICTHVRCNTINYWLTT